MIQRFIKELGEKDKPFKLHYDSLNAIHLMKNSSFHIKSKHIAVSYHFIRDVIEDGSVIIEKIHTSPNRWMPRRLGVV